jgi:hypothetical protein
MQKHRVRQEMRRCSWTRTWRPAIEIAQTASRKHEYFGAIIVSKETVEIAELSRIGVWSLHFDHQNFIAGSQQRFIILTEPVMDIPIHVIVEESASLPTRKVEQKLKQHYWRSPMLLLTDFVRSRDQCRLILSFQPTATPAAPEAPVERIPITMLSVYIAKSRNPPHPPRFPQRNFFVTLFFVD